MPCPTIQVDKYQITLNSPAIDLKTAITNSTTKDKEKATLEKVGSAEMQMGEKWLMTVAVGKELQSWRRVTDRLTHRGVHRENTPKTIG